MVGTVALFYLRDKKNKELYKQLLRRNLQTPLTTQCGAIDLD